ncbi:MAG: endonuclease NucS [Frankiales bacterium]|nr:endonuclease NucS [Frankiales bacterium]MCW2584973.1 endonuclease NucS [Frankiales bacterium]
MGVRLVIARCSVDYVGRLTAHLPQAVRLLLVKSDGSVSIHADDRAYKPLMWMSPPCSTLYGEDVWTVTNKAGEQLLITVDEVLSDVAHELGTDPGLVKDGVEKQLQELLADQCHVLGEGFTLVQREYFTDIGPVDLLCKDGSGAHVLVEIKRHAEIDAVEQLTRYLQRVSTVLGEVQGILAAQSFKPQAKVLAADRGIICVQVDYDALRGMESTRPTLF